MKVTNVKVILNQATITKLNEAAQKSMRLTAEAIVTDITSRGVVPFDVGTLEESGYVAFASDFVYAIIYSTPYARRWYFNAPNDEGKKASFQKIKNPNAQDHWMDYYLDGEGKQWVIDTFVKFFKQESGGLIK